MRQQRLRGQPKASFYRGDSVVPWLASRVEMIFPLGCEVYGSSNEIIDDLPSQLHTLNSVKRCMVLEPLVLDWHSLIILLWFSIRIIGSVRALRSISTFIATSASPLITIVSRPGSSIITAVPGYSVLVVVITFLVEDLSNCTCCHFCG